MRKNTWFRISLVLIIIGICYLSLTPTETIIVGNDKISHFIAYSILMTNIGLLTYEYKLQFKLGVIGAVLFGIVIEVIQHFVPGRYMSFYDVLANSAGVLIGVIFIILFYHRLNKFFKRINLR